ncbi:hypothetical protein ACFY78_34980 [Streptomyces olindensis]|uniref:hypothetical protein n=1 Tax=Streptomyces olindensis TaxID=358823 RepID=UPI0036BDC544
MSWTRRPLTVLAVCVLLAGAAGCGAGDAPEGGASPTPVGRLLEDRDKEGRPYREVEGEGAPDVGVQVQPDRAGGWDVRLTLRNFRFSPAGAAARAVPGRGLAHLYVDGRLVARLRTPGHRLAAGLVPRGTHHVTARLYADDGTVWAVDGRPVESTADITASKPGPNATPSASVRPGAGASASPSATVRPGVGASPSPSTTVRPGVGAPAAPSATLRPGVGAPAAPSATGPAGVETLGLSSGSARSGEEARGLSSGIARPGVKALGLSSGSARPGVKARGLPSGIARPGVKALGLSSGSARPRPEALGLSSGSARSGARTHAAPGATARQGSGTSGPDAGAQSGGRGSPGRAGQAS